MNGWLCADYLFPAANLMAKQKADPQFSLTNVPHTELYFALNARCSTKASRQVSFSSLQNCSAPAYSPAGIPSRLGILQNSLHLSSTRTRLTVSRPCNGHLDKEFEPCSSQQCYCRPPLTCWLT